MTDSPWPDAVRARLLEQRVITLFGALEESNVTSLAAELWSLDALGDEPITLVCSIRGGSVSATLALIDALDMVGVEVRAMCVGGITGPPIGLLGAVAVREAAPGARFLLRDEHVSLSGNASDLDRAVREHHAQRTLLLERLAPSTKGRRSLGDLVADVERGKTLSAPEAVEYGLIDHIAESPRARSRPKAASDFAHSLAELRQEAR